MMFLAFFHSKIWAKFHFGTFKPYDLEKSWKILSSKNIKFQGWLKIAYFLQSGFCGFLSITPIKTIK